MNQGMNPYQAPTAQTLSQQADRDWKWLLFSFDGRARRGEYWLGTFYMILAMMVLGAFAAVTVYALGIGDSGNSAPSPLMLIVFGVLGVGVLVPMLWASLAVSIKRWHDRNKSGLWVLIGMIPYLGSLWVFIECGCLRGTQGNNDYGPDPLA